MPRHAEAIGEAITKVSIESSAFFFANGLPKQTEKFWNRLVIANGLAPEFRRLSYWSANPFFQQIRVSLR